MDYFDITTTICSWSVFFMKGLPIIFITAFLISLFFKKWRQRIFLKSDAKLSALKGIYIFIATLIGLALFVLFGVLYSQIISIQCNIPQAHGEFTIEDINANFALAFLGTVTGLVALFGGFLAIIRTDENKIQNEIADRKNDIANDTNEITRQINNITEKKSITDRLNRATEALGQNHNDGKPVIEVRLGALYELERIAQDSISEHIRIMEIFCTYIRHNKELTSITDGKIIPREDVQAALTIIGRRDKWSDDGKYLQKEKEQGYWLDLRNCDLRRTLLDNADLSHANMSKTWFNEVTLEKAVLIETNLSGAHLNNVNLSNADVLNTNFKNTHTKGSFAYKGDLLECINLTQIQLNQMFLGKGIAVPKNLYHPQAGTIYDKIYDTFEDFMRGYDDWKIKTNNDPYKPPPQQKLITNN